MNEEEVIKGKDYDKSENALIRNFVNDIKHNGKCFVRDRKLKDKIIEIESNITSNFIPENNLYEMEYNNKI